VALLASPACGQDQSPAAISDLAQIVDKKNADWSALTASLEPRLARFLPCDARVKTAVEEVSRASDVRFAAMSAYWQEIERQSKEQAQTATALAGENDGRLALWSEERADSEKARAVLEDHAADLQVSVKGMAALTAASRNLDDILRNSESITRQSLEREEAIAQLNARWKDVARSSPLRDAAIENELKSLANERDRWNAFYAARIARAQMECSLTGAQRTAAPRTASPRTTAPRATDPKAAEKKSQ
jgi:hypothetical protein